MGYAFHGFAAITHRVAAWISPRHARLGEGLRAVNAVGDGIAVAGPEAMPFSTELGTNTDDIDDACVGCEAKSGSDCGRCAYLLEALGRMAVPVTIEAPSVPSKPIFLPALPAREAAVAFVAHMRRHGKCGTFSNGALKNAYLLYCQQERRRPTAENVLREAMGMLPGVSKELLRDSSQRGRRARLTEWVISPAETVSGNVSRRPRLVESERVAA